MKGHITTSGLTIHGSSVQIEILCYSRSTSGSFSPRVLVHSLYVPSSSICVLLQIVARVLQPQGVNIGSVNIAESLELSQNLGEFQFNFETLFGREIDSGAHARDNASTTGLNHDTDAPLT